MIGRSNRAEVRNPLVALPSFRSLAALGDPERAMMRTLLLELREDARLGAAESWRRRKPPMAVYWAAVGVNAGHAARALSGQDLRDGRREGRAVRSGGNSAPVVIP